MGDTMRSLSPFAKFFRGAALGWLKEARNKYHLGLDVHSEEGKQVFKDLVAHSDVVVENLRAGTMDRWGIGYRQLKEVNPKIIYIALNGFGQWGPYLERPSYDAIAQAESGMAWISGFPDKLPMKSGIWVADLYGGLNGAVGVLAAINHRNRTGEGQFIELSQAENMVRSLDWTWLYQGFTGNGRERYGNRDVAICPSDIFQSKDEMVAVAAATDEQFKGLCRAMEMPEMAEDSRFATHQARLQEDNATALLGSIRSWAAQKTYAEIDELAGKHYFGAQKVSNNKDHFEDEHLRRRNFTYTIDDLVYGEVTQEGVVPKMSETPARIKWTGRPVGFHNEYVLKRFLGYPAQKIKELQDGKVIGKWVETPPGRKPPEGWDGTSGLVLA
jgi:crotonobetainyl-CoA:carnitine CoA-transferase CaiB-like acyl-CoA transferase